MSHTPSPSQGARILLVEDDDAARFSLARVLERVGYQVEAVADGETAVALLDPAAAGRHFDLVLTDLVMREIDGIEVLDHARKLADPPEVILLTGYGTLQTAIDALRAGAFDYLLKPCKPDDLLRCIERAMERRAALIAQLAAVQVVARSFLPQGAEQAESQGAPPPAEPDTAQSAGS